jgi:hypothetical protein
MRWTGRIPSLAKEGWPRIKKISPFLCMARTGCFVPSSDYRLLEQTTPSAPSKDASRYLINWRSHPSFAKEGNPPFHT